MTNDHLIKGDAYKGLLKSKNIFLNEIRNDGKTPRNTQKVDEVKQILKMRLKDRNKINIVKLKDNILRCKGKP